MEGYYMGPYCPQKLISQKTIGGSHLVFMQPAAAEISTWLESMHKFVKLGRVVRSITTAIEDLVIAYVLFN